MGERSRSQPWGIPVYWIKKPKHLFGLSLVPIPILQEGFPLLDQAEVHVLGGPPAMVWVNGYLFAWIHKVNSPKWPVNVSPESLFQILMALVVILLFSDLYFGSRRTRLWSEQPSGTLIWTLLEFVAKENSTGLLLIFEALWRFVFTHFCPSVRHAHYSIGSNEEHQVVGGAYRGWGRSWSGGGGHGGQCVVRFCGSLLKENDQKSLFWPSCVSKVMLEGHKCNMMEKKIFIKMGENKVRIGGKWLQHLDSFAVDQLFIHPVYIDLQR